MGPIIRMSSSGTHGTGGVGCCCFRCCTCIHVEFFKSLPGIIKVCETVISGLIQSLLINYGLGYSSSIGSAFEGSLTTASACFLISALLLACYAISEKSYNLIPYYMSPGFDVYPAMTAAYILSGVVGLLHGADAYLSYVHYKTGR
ncbi:PREDICTED: uncharacterized protein LOC105153644 [Acromyrmex echinatior]|uniref:uncharacterized protein LOC105153644 n=1 Tax=Acromyrmex echinatior TaxID=103372 RepID=UPI000580ECFE|nr:PREDICTED: uncharacterized protein LOC105153644 [Acromyrmex echinatior]